MTDKTIGRVAAGIATLAALIAIIFVANLLGLIPTGPFWENLFAGVLSGMIVVSLVAFLLPTYLRALFAPRVQLEPEEDFELSRYLDSRLKGTMRLTIRNEGHNTVRAFYWHLVIPRELNPVVQDLRGRIIGARKLGEYDYVHGLVDDKPVFPGCGLELPITVQMDTADNRLDWGIKYSISTEHGHFPHEMRLHRKMDASALADCADFSIRSVVSDESDEETEPVVTFRFEPEPATEPAEERETVTMNF